MKMPELNEKCGNCNHEYKFHIDGSGTVQPCDADVEESNTADEDVVSLCCCPQFEQVADPAEALVSRCSICGEEGGGHGRGCVLYEDEGN